MPPPQHATTAKQSEARQGQHADIGFGHGGSVGSEVRARQSQAAATLAAKAKFKTLAGRNSDQVPQNGQYDARSVRALGHHAAAEDITGAGDISGGNAAFAQGQAMP